MRGRIKSLVRPMIWDLFYPGSPANDVREKVAGTIIPQRVFEGFGNDRLKSVSILKQCLRYWTAKHLKGI